MASDHINLTNKLDQDEIFLGLKTAITDYSIFRVKHFLSLPRTKDEKNRSCTLDWEQGNFLLRRALQKQMPDIATLLLDYGVQVNRSHNQPCNTPLHLAVTQNDINMVEKLLNRGADINAKNSMRKSVLYLAVELNNEEIVEMLLKYNNKPNFKSKWVTTDRAAENGNEKIFNMLVNCGAKSDLQNLDGTSLLHVAIEKGYTSTIKQIIEKKNYDITDSRNNKVLTVAVMISNNYRFRCNYDDIIRLLVDAKFPIDPKMIKDAKFIHIVVSKGYTSILNDLLRLGADPNAINSEGCSLLMTACSYKSKADIAKILIENKANVTVKDRSGRTVLHCAISNLHSSSYDSYINYLSPSFYENDDVEEKFLDDENTCCSNEWFEIIKILIDLGVNVNDKNDQMMSPLHYVAKKMINIELFHYIEELTTLLLNAGAEISARNKNGDTPLQYAVINGRSEMVEMLLPPRTPVDSIFFSNYRKQTLIHSASTIKSPTILKLLLKREEFKNVDVKDIEGNTPLLLAVKNVRKKAVEILLNHGADVNVANEELMTPLHYASNISCKKIVEMLLQHKANPNCIDRKGQTPLVIAALGEDDFTVKFLLKHGADINFKSGKSEKTALHYLAEREKAVTFNILNYGADINNKTADNKTALDCLIESMVSYCCKNKISYDSLSQFGRAQYLTRDFHRNAYVLIRHILQRQAINFFVCQENLRAVDKYEIEYDWMDDVNSGKNPKIKELRIIIKKEVELMKQHIFNNTNVNLYQILTKCPHRVAKYVLKNDNVIQQLQVPDFFQKLPYYYVMLSRCIDYCLERKKILDQDVDYSFHYVFPYLPFTCIDEILCYLNNDDLKALINVCQLTIDYQDTVSDTLPQSEVIAGNVAKKMKN